MAGARVRRWYVVQEIGDIDFALLVSAYSVKAVRREAIKHFSRFRITLAKTWEFVKVMSGNPVNVGYRDGVASNRWSMASEFMCCDVVILS